MFVDSLPRPLPIIRRSLNCAPVHSHVVMAGLVPAIHVAVAWTKDVDARVKPGHDGATNCYLDCSSQSYAIALAWRDRVAISQNRRSARRIANAAESCRRASERMRASISSG
ncbi:hypothetical protein [Bradyrhizobium sp. HKCCYLS20291]|uniref:hypothetical protein n=1 Tax=Bradyrhizobium sp. HKCCYLS20291 TaxID=3420766 RepID=UPI003EBE29D9